MTSLALWILMAMMRPHDTPEECCVGNKCYSQGFVPSVGSPITKDECKFIHGKWIGTRDESMDLPAIQVKRNTGISHVECVGKDKWDVYTTYPEPTSCGTGYTLQRWQETQTSWSCADKSRVLLTDESGKKHCIKF